MDTSQIDIHSTEDFSKSKSPDKVVRTKKSYEDGHVDILPICMLLLGVLVHLMMLMGGLPHLC